MHLYTMDQSRENGAFDDKNEDKVSLFAWHISLIHLLVRYIWQYSGFYALFPDGQSGSVSYMAKAVVNRLLQEGLSYDTSKQCCIS